MRIGFTGSQDGMSARQLQALRVILLSTKATELHHGDCIGADAQADALVRQLNGQGLTHIDVVIHPPIDPKKRAFCAQPGDAVWEPLPYLERNRDIVDSANMVIAGPKSGNEVARSGTWATVRYARKIGREVRVLKR
jgi:hypothetical protein